MFHCFLASFKIIVDENCYERCNTNTMLYSVESGLKVVNRSRILHILIGDDEKYCSVGGNIFAMESYISPSTYGSQVLNMYVMQQKTFLGTLS